MNPPLLAASSDHDHLVEFYERDETLVASVARFVAPSLQAGEVAVVVATPDHIGAITAALAVLIPGTWDPDDLIVLDAADTLDRFMVDGMPDRERFDAVIGGLIATAAARSSRLRVFGEMVAVLWDESNVTGALALEDLWNDLLGRQEFSLLCGYPTRSFESPHADDFQHVCDRHQAVIPSESFPSLADPTEQLRAVAILQHETRAGATERAQLRERERELEAALERLGELDRLRNEFIAMVVHDIGSPTALIAAVLSHLADHWTEFDRDDIDQHLQIALRATGNIQRLTDDVLTAARLEAREFRYDRRPMDLVAVLTEVAAEVGSTTGRRIAIDAAADPPLVMADPARQAQVLRNLLSNAVKFSDSDDAVSVSLRVDGDHLVVAVQDEGPGIAPADLPRLFRPFSRLATEGGAGGSGLGLHITRELVEGQGGTIEVDSTAGVGSTFTYTVPIARPADADVSPRGHGTGMVHTNDHA